VKSCRKKGKSGLVGTQNSPPRGKKEKKAKKTTSWKATQRRRGSRSTVLKAQEDIRWGRMRVQIYQANCKQCRRSGRLIRSLELKECIFARVRVEMIHNGIALTRGRSRKEGVWDLLGHKQGVAREKRGPRKHCGKKREGGSRGGEPI